MEDEKLIYKKELFGLGMELKIFIENQAVDAKVFDILSGDEYILHKTDAEGNFIGKVRSGYESVLRDISEKCFDSEVFHFSQTKRVTAYVREKYRTELEFLWDSSPNSAVMRRADSKKWYGVIMTIPKNRLGFDSKEETEVINLHGKEEKLKALVDNIKYFPGWHMNKKYWMTVILDDSISDDELFLRIDESYNLGKR